MKSNWFRFIFSNLNLFFRQYWSIKQPLSSFFHFMELMDIKKIHFDSRKWLKRWLFSHRWNPIIHLSLLFIQKLKNNINKLLYHDWFKKKIKGSKLYKLFYFKNLRMYMLFFLIYITLSIFDFFFLIHLLSIPVSFINNTSYS
jgi:hypothetical protein